MGFLSEPLSIIQIKPRRKIGDITVNVTLKEDTVDTLTITKQPVQQGASITDHAYMEPTVFSMSILFRENISTPLADIYEDLLDLQSSMEPFDVVTPKRIYHNMLIARLGQTTDKSTENTLAINISFQEVIIVKVSTTQVPRTSQRDPSTTGKTENAGKKSFLKQTTEIPAALKATP